MRTAQRRDRSSARQGLRLVAAGRRWDAVRVPTRQGEALVDALGTRCGDVIRDGPGYLFLITPGTGDLITTPDVTVYGRSRHVLIPAGDHTAPPGPHWVRPAFHLALEEVQ
ncbi:hypothetical protein H181DRAFT_01799 [Streptomyces sp. WMMB 714]|nr:hypothetical protein H181DRAFT_01799 [Streptomyces sp. WMMB 714]